MPAAAESSPTPEPTRIGRYQILDVLSEGRRGKVYRAAVTGPGGFAREVALEVVRREVRAKKGFAEVFEREANLLSKLDHPNVVTLYDFGEDGEDLFLCLERVHGRDLGSWLEVARKARSGPLPVGIAVRIAEQVARGLDHVHRLAVGGAPQHLVHRDVTPSSILIAFDGAVKLTDFGIAGIDGRPPTGAGIAKDEAAYLSPEQLEGRGLDGRSDIFSLGAVLWELLANRHLFGERGTDGEQVAAAVRTRPIEPPSSCGAVIPAELDEIVLKALERDVARRYATAADFADALLSCDGPHHLLAGPYQIAKALRKSFPDDEPSVGIDIRGAGVAPPGEDRPRLPEAGVPASATADDTDGRTAEIATGADRANRPPRWYGPAAVLAGGLAVAALAYVSLSPWAEGPGEGPAREAPAPTPSAAAPLERHALPPAGAAAATQETNGSLSPWGEGRGEGPPRGAPASIPSAATPRAPSVARPFVPSHAPASERSRGTTLRPPKNRKPPAPTGPPGLLDVINVIPVVGVTIDGHEVGWSPHLGFVVPPGRHRIVLKTEDGPRRSFTVRMPPAGHMIFRGPFATVQPHALP